VDAIFRPIVGPPILAAAALSRRPCVDRVGLGWRPELAAGILSHLDSIDVIEVIADDYFDHPARIRALKTLSAQSTVVLHGIALGMASTAPVDPKRLAKMARLFEQIRPESWSEHLAFVRSGDIEIGHLAAPPRTPSTIDATAENLEAARKTVGSLPLVENIATLIDPPVSTLDEPEWLTQTLHASGAGMLLDLHNLYANSINFGIENFLERLPLHRVHAVHISGGRMMGERLLDDHLHDPPDPVYDLLATLAAQCPNPMTVILERDGSYPPMAHLLAQLDRARSALKKGRHERSPAGKIPGDALHRSESPRPLP
jgi:uncharacterized protein (UPF0276 family)